VRLIDAGMYCDYSIIGDFVIVIVMVMVIVIVYVSDLCCTFKLHSYSHLFTRHFLPKIFIAPLFNSNLALYYTIMIILLYISFFYLHIIIPHLHCISRSLFVYNIALNIFFPSFHSSGKFTSAFKRVNNLLELTRLVTALSNDTFKFKVKRIRSLTEHEEKLLRHIPRNAKNRKCMS
jgi:hypothetical protein